MWIVRLALRRPYTIAVFSLVVLLLGALAARRMRADIFPTVDIPVVVVVWNYPGLPASDMESRVVLIAERGYSTTVSGIAKIESQSMNGIGLLKVYFESDTDTGAAIAQLTATSTTIIKLLPQGITPPAILPYNAANVPVAQLTVDSESRSEQELFDYGRNFLRVRLFTVPGLATPFPYGGKDRQIMVDIDPARVTASGLAAQDVVQAVMQSNLTIPAGNARIGTIDYDVTLNNSPDSIAEFDRLPLRTQNGRTVYLSDVATVHDGFAVQQNVVRVNGRRATYLAIIKKANASTLAVVDAARELLPLLRATAPEGVELKIEFDQSRFVRAALQGVVKEAVVSSILVAFMILAFLGSWRSVVIVSTSIPVAILCALLGLYLTGQTLNIMTLGGISLAIGMLVDDATVEIENIHRNRQLGKPLAVAILSAAQQVATPALASTLTICIVFFPVVFLVGPAKYLFTPLAMAVVFAMLASYVLSRTLVPTLSRQLLLREEHAVGRVQALRERALAALERGYGRVLDAVLKRRGAALLYAVALLGITAYGATSIGLDFFPNVDAGQLRLHVRAPVGTRIEETEQRVAAIERRIREIIPPEELATINDSIGLPSFYNLAFVSTDNIGGQDADILVALQPEHQPTEIYRRRIRAMLAEEHPDVTAYFQAADIIAQVLNFGLSAPIDIEVEGPKLPTSRELAARLRQRLRQIPGVVDIRTPQVFDRPALRIDVDRERALDLGVAQRDVANNMLTSLSSSFGLSPSFWVNPANNVNYVVAVQTPLRSMASVGDILATSLSPPTAAAAGPEGAPAVAPYLGMLAAVRPTQTTALISHDAVQRVIDVQCGVEGRDLGAVTTDIRAAIAELGALPPGVRITLRGQSDSMTSSFRSLAAGLLLASVFVYLLLVILFQSWLDPLIIIAAVPGALAGVLWMLALTRTTLNVESFMGAIMSVGVAVANSILLVSFANDVRAGQPLDARTAAARAGRTRLRPVLMTALAMILGMVPVAIGAGEGGEQNAPLGRAVIGGLVVATAVTLFLVPVIYSLLRQRPPSAHSLDARFAAETATLSDAPDAPDSMEVVR
jgi:multidrug efflux pump subunit AcrB